MTMKASLEVVVLRVADVDSSVEFYRDMVGFDLEVDYAPSPTFRVVQLTPRGSSTSIQFGVGLPDAPDGVLGGLCLVVDDIEAPRGELIAAGVAVSETRHRDTRGDWCGEFIPGPDPGHADYASFADF